MGSNRRRRGDRWHNAARSGAARRSGVCRVARSRQALCERRTVGRGGVRSEWVRIEGDVATVGITQHAQERLGDLVFVELPEVGKRFAKGAPSAVAESDLNGFESKATWRPLA